VPDVKHGQDPMPRSEMAMRAIQVGADRARTVFASVHGHAQAIIVAPPGLVPVPVRVRR
jgi:hypothetical protein